MRKLPVPAVSLALALAACDGDDSPSGSSGSLRVTCSATPTSGTVPLDVRFNASISGAEANPVIIWSFGDGSAASEASGSRTYFSPGTYTASVEVRSGRDRSSCSVSVTAQPAPPRALPPNAMPVARFKVVPYPPEGKPPLTVNFNACQSSDPDGDRLLFRFDVFDGLYDSLHCRREHTYRSSGIFQTRVCVTDDYPGHADICQSYTVTVR